MSATPPPALEGTHAPSPFEVLWERYRSLILTVVGALFVALLGNYGWKYYNQRQIDERESKFVATIGADESYTTDEGLASLTESLADVSMESLEKAAAAADAKHKPWLLWSIARKAVLEANWDRATKALDELESGFPKHTLVVQSTMPVQSREQEKPPEDATPAQRRVPKWEPAVEGSQVGLMRKQIEEERGFKKPDSFAKPEIPGDAPRVKFVLGETGSFVIALMPQAPAHTAKFLELARAGFWNGVAIDEIQRSTDAFDRPAVLHLGYASTKEEDTTKWSTTEPSENQVEFEATGLSHFEGAVAARNEAEGKSCADRFWVCVDDAAENDGSRVVFGYVVEGLDVLRGICEAGMSSAQEEERGQGRPAEIVRVTATEVL